MYMYMYMQALVVPDCHSNNHTIVIFSAHVHVYRYSSLLYYSYLLSTCTCIEISWFLTIAVGCSMAGGLLS